MEHCKFTADSPMKNVIDLSFLPPVYILASHLADDQQHEAEDTLINAGAPLTYDIKEANLVLGNIQTTRRAKLELQWKGLHVIDEEQVTFSDSDDSTPARKRAKARVANADSDASSLASPDPGLEGEDEAPESQSMSRLSISQASTGGDRAMAASADGFHEASFSPSKFKGKVIVARLEWLYRSLKAKARLPLDPHILYISRVKTSCRPVTGNQLTTVTQEAHVNLSKAQESKGVSSQAKKIIERARADEKPGEKKTRKRDRIKEAADQNFAGRTFSSNHNTGMSLIDSAGPRPLRLLRENTSENDETDDMPLPPMPEWVLQKKLYSCERATPVDSPNRNFICLLKKIKLARLLTSDEIGVRAYSTSIAAIAAYPYRLQSAREVLALPGCDQKIAHLFSEYRTTGGNIQAVIDLEADQVLSVLREFYDIWGVGARTAREFYFDKGWRDLDDVIQYGWETLSRVQQIGLKYYDEFKLKISRTEVESIAAIITRHAKLLTDDALQTIIVGSYRRGKPESGDVDVILSHPMQEMTLELVSQVVKSLEKEGWITHTLMLNLTNTKREQEPLPIRASTLAGPGFDTLDKALVVWQDREWPTRESDLASNPKAKNPNPHRRVDIIISPWRTIGCAIAGWTSGTTFQRDLRRYAKKAKGWKFDSSGVRDRATGGWVDLEGWRNEKTRCRDWKEAEWKVFEGMGLVYREPWDRCTG